VLRGPQGTLFGRNASAGLIHVISRRPNLSQIEGFAELSYGNYDMIRAAGAINVPFGESVAARIDAVYTRRDGFYTVVNPQGGTEGDVNDRDRIFVRGQLLFEPSEDITFRLIGDYTFRDESCCGAVTIEARETFDPTPGQPGDFAFSPNENRVVTIMRRQGGRFSALGDPFSRLIDVSPGRTFRNETVDYGISGQLDWDLGAARLTSITAYREYRSEGAGDVDYSNVDIIYRANDGNAQREFSTFSQELRLQGSAFNGVLDWLVGGYYAKEDLTVLDNLKFGTQYGPFAACRALAGSNVASPLLPFLNPLPPAVCRRPAARSFRARCPARCPLSGPPHRSSLRRSTGSATA
jgi:outer membrane receptor protein involved in Fe transport